MSYALGLCYIYLWDICMGIEPVYTFLGARNLSPLLRSWRDKSCINLPSLKSDDFSRQGGSSLSEM